MKFKIKIESKDLVIFVVFSIFLFYLCCILVTNVTSFAAGEGLVGLNPFLAFNGDQFPQVMVVFILILIFLITSVSSSIFNKEKGFGFEVGAKKDKKYARWATEKEMKKELVKIDPTADEIEAGGIPLIMNKKEVWVDNGGYHSLIIGSTGAGKTQTTVFPMVKNLSKHGESMIITDPKGEIYEDTAEMLKEKGYQIVLLNFRDPQKGNSWNPLSLPYQLYKEGNQDKATEILDDLALNILYDKNSKSQDPFWEKTSADYFAGLAQALFEDATEDQINLNSINLMTTVGEDRFMGSTYMKEYFSFKDPTSAAYINVSSTINAPNETKGSILSVFRQKIKLFATRENLSEMLGHNDFDMKEIGRHKTAVFIIIQDEKTTYHSLVTIFLKQCYETLISVAQESGGKLPHRTNFILDEFANMPPLQDVTTMVTAARSRNIRFNFIIQNFAQLYEVYGKENGETIKGNCGNIVYLISSELSALEEISKMCGEEKAKEGEKVATQPLVTVSDLQRLKQWDIIVLRIRMMPFKTTLTPNFKMNWGKSYPKATYPQRVKEPVKVFDIKGYVETKKQEKMKEMMGGNTPSPMMPGMGSFPGMGGLPGMPKASPFPSMGPSPFSGIMPSKPSDGNVDVDELIKRIDAKIAELEEEERQEREAEEKKQAASEIEKKEEKEEEIIPIIPEKRKKEEPIESEEKNQESISEPLEKERKIIEDKEINPIKAPVILENKPIEPVKKEEPVVEAVIEETPKKEPKQEKKPVPLEKTEIKESVLPEKENPEKTEEQKKTSIPKVEIQEDEITDDQFFDDFFYDEDE